MGHNSFSSTPVGLDLMDYRKDVQNLINKQDLNDQNLDRSRSGLYDFAQALNNQTGAGSFDPIQQAAITQSLRQNAQYGGNLAGARGVAPAVAGRLIARNAAQAPQSLANSFDLLRTQQAMDQQGLQAQALGQLRQQDLGARDVNNSYINAFGQLQNEQNRLRSLNYNTANKINADIAAKNASSIGGTIGGLAGAVGGTIATVATGGAAAPLIPAFTAAGAKSGGGAAHGGIVPGKAPVDGDHPANDTVPMQLSPGEIVLPRSVADDPEKAKEFVEALLRKEQKTEDYGYSRVVQARRALDEIASYYCGGKVKNG